MTITNWNSTASCEPAREVVPRDLQHLIAIVKDSEPSPSPLRAVGSLHSLNPCFTTDGTLVQMKTEAFGHIGEPKNGSITVGAGVTMFELRDALTPHELQIEVVPEIGNATAGSVACCGTKDASLGPDGLGQISSTVTGIKMVDAGGNVVDVSGEQLQETRSSYGLLGIVFEVTFKTIPRRKLRYAYESLKVTPALTFEQVLGGASGFLGFLMPYHGKLVVERRTILNPPPDDKSPVKFLLDPFKLWIRDRAWEHIGKMAKVPIDRGDWLPTLDETLETFLKDLGSFDAWAGSSMIPFKSTGHAFDFAFWAFPRRSWKEAIPGYLDFCRAFREKTGFRSALPTEVYFMRRDDSALLSVCPALSEPPELPDDDDVFTLDLVDIVPRKPEDDARWRAMNEEFNEFAARYGARPLLNQTKFLSPAHMKMLNEHWPPAIKERWAKFAKIRKEKDPKDRFLTPYFKKLLDVIPT